MLSARRWCMDWDRVLHSNASLVARQKSTLSAINRGLRASKQKPARDKDNKSGRGAFSREDAQPSRSFERSSRASSPGDARVLAPSKWTRRQSGGTRDAESGQEEASFGNRTWTAPHRFDRRAGRDGAGGQRTGARDDGDDDANSHQAPPSRGAKDQDSPGPRILKHTAGEGAGSRVFNKSDIKADIEKVLRSTRAIRAVHDAGDRVSLDTIRDTRRTLQAITAAILEMGRESANGNMHAPAKQFRRRLMEMGAFVREDEIQDLKAEQTMVMETREKGRFVLLLRGQKAQACVRPDPALQATRGEEDESHARQDRRVDNPVTHDVDLIDHVNARSKAKTRSRKEANEDDGIPVAIPRTTAASEFLYGVHVVHAALRAKRRKLYVLYIANDSPARPSSDPSLPGLARAAGVGVKKASRDLLNQMSGDRPHNNAVLEASTLPAPPVLSLGTPDAGTGATPLVLSLQSAEDIAVNGNPASLPSSSKSSRQPFIVFLDGIVDEGNLGNILRTAHFYGVDAVAVATNTCAPLTSPVMGKASAGACEAVQLLAVPRPAQFIFESAAAGWKVYAAVAPDHEYETKAEAEKVSSGSIGMTRPLERHPCILMLGAEGEGLRANLVKKAHYLLSINRGDSSKDAVDIGVDSLNVGVAAGVLMDAFLRESDFRGADRNSKEVKQGESDLVDLNRTLGF